MEVVDECWGVREEVSVPREASAGVAVGYRWFYMPILL